MLKQFEIYFMLFFIYSVLGWLMEVANNFVVEKKFVNRGFLIGPYCPIYGYGVILMTLLLRKYQDDIVATFIFSILICGILEYFTSYFLEKIFHARWWDYSKRKFNINGRICVNNLLIFGILGCLIMYISNPFFINLLNKIPNIVLTILTFFILACYLADNFISGKIIFNIKEISNDIKRDNTEEISEKVKKLIKSKLTLHKRVFKAYPNLKNKINIDELIEKGKKKIQNMKDKVNEIKEKRKNNN